uniref:Ig-like domain-containing protein n=1 Tax=Paramormyrops kingsleyae TaxID=1676925 RepID=A0A3B3QAN7_9TELE
MLHCNICVCFFCSPENGRADRTKNHTIPPVFLHKIQPLEINVGSRARFECEIEEAPNVKFKWFKSGSEMRDSDKCRIISHHLSSSMELLNPTKAESGEYTCKATNKYGSDSCSASLNVAGKWNEWCSTFFSDLATLQIANCSVDNSGDYVCEASSEAGSDRCNSVITVKGL